LARHSYSDLVIRIRLMRGRSLGKVVVVVEGSVKLWGGRNRCMPRGEMITNGWFVLRDELLRLSFVEGCSQIGELKGRRVVGRWVGDLLRQLWGRMTGIWGAIAAYQILKQGKREGQVLIYAGRDIGKCGI
jgi:hypothetical protein